MHGPCAALRLIPTLFLAASGPQVLTTLVLGQNRRVFSGHTRWSSVHYEPMCL